MIRRGVPGVAPGYLPREGWLLSGAGLPGLTVCPQHSGVDSMETKCHQTETDKVTIQSLLLLPQRLSDLTILCKLAEHQQPLPYIEMPQLGFSSWLCYLWHTGADGHEGKTETPEKQLCQQSSVGLPFYFLFLIGLKARKILVMESLHFYNEKQMVSDSHNSPIAENRIHKQI